MYELLITLNFTSVRASKACGGHLEGWTKNDPPIPVEFDDSSGQREIIIANEGWVVRFRINKPGSAECISAVIGSRDSSTEDLWGKGMIFLRSLIEGNYPVDRLSMPTYRFVPDQE